MHERDGFTILAKKAKDHRCSPTRFKEFHMNSNRVYVRVSCDQVTISFCGMVTVHTSRRRDHMRVLVSLPYLLHLPSAE